jgi:hypothetical protein
MNIVPTNTFDQDVRDYIRKKKYRHIDILIKIRPPLWGFYYHSLGMNIILCKCSHIARASLR